MCLMSPKLSLVSAFLSLAFGVALRLQFVSVTLLHIDESNQGEISLN